jgi:hypothetical protein
VDKRPEADAGGPTQGGPGPSRAARRRHIRTPRKPMPRPTRAGPTPSVNTGVGRSEGSKGGLGAGPVSGRRQLRGRAVVGRGVRLGYHLGALVRLPRRPLLCCRFGTSGAPPGSRRTASRRGRPVGRAAPGPPSSATPRGRRSRWARTRRAAPTARVPARVQLHVDAKVRAKELRQVHGAGACFGPGVAGARRPFVRSGSAHLTVIFRAGTSTSRRRRRAGSSGRRGPYAPR